MTEALALLREPFKPESVGKLPRVTCKDCSDRSKTCSKHQKSKCNECGNFISTAHIHLDYVGHAEVTDRLLTVDPGWSWEPCAFNDLGLPVVGKGAGGESILWIRLTICGVTRLGVGSVAPNAFDSEKQLIGDAIRNAAMRFGVALDLWAKEELESSLPSHGADDVAVNPVTGEITDGSSNGPRAEGGSGASVPPASPPAPASRTRRPPPGRAAASKSDAGTAATTMPAAALDSIRRLGERKGLDDSGLEQLAGVDFGGLSTLTTDQANELVAKVQAYVKPEDDPGRPFSFEKGAGE